MPLLEKIGSWPVKVAMSPTGQSLREALVCSCLSPCLTCAVGAYLYDRQGAERDANQLLTLVANLDLPDL